MQFFRSYVTNPQSPSYVDISDLYPSAQTICTLIKQAGGKVFIPHIFAYGDSSLSLLEELSNDLTIDGIECFYNSFTEKQTNCLINFCKERNLLISAGSDYHGANRPSIKFGASDERFESLIKWL